MAPQSDRALREKLRAAGCSFVRQGKGSHEISSGTFSPQHNELMLRALVKGNEEFRRTFSLLGRRIVFAATGLSNTAHTLQLTVLGTKNPASSGVRLDVDAFTVLS